MTRFSGECRRCRGRPAFEREGGTASSRLTARRGGRRDDEDGDSQRYIIRSFLKHILIKQSFILQVNTMEYVPSVCASWFLFCLFLCLLLVSFSLGPPFLSNPISVSFGNSISGGTATRRVSAVVGFLVPTPQMDNHRNHHTKRRQPRPQG